MRECGFSSSSGSPAKIGRIALIITLVRREPMQPCGTKTPQQSSWWRLTSHQPKKMPFSFPGSACSDAGNRLPDNDAFLRHQVHRVPFLDLESLVEARLAHQRAVGAELVRRVRVCFHLNDCGPARASFRASPSIAAPSLRNFGLLITANSALTPRHCTSSWMAASIRLSVALTFRRSPSAW